MTYAAAIVQLKTLSFTGLANSYDAVNMPPSNPDLPALVIEDSSQPFVEGLLAWNIPTTKGNALLFVDHLLLIRNIWGGSAEERRADMITYLDRYLTAIQADMFLAGNLVVPLQLIVIKRGSVFVRKREYLGIRFRHRWEFRIG